MLHPSTRKLIDRLSEMTQQARIDWAEGENHSIVYETEGYRITLNGDPGSLLLSDLNGKELEHASADELAATTDETGTNYGQILSDMKIEAGRIARGTEKAISAVLAGLEAPLEEIASAPASAISTGEDPEGESVAEATAELADATDPGTDDPHDHTATPDPEDGLSEEAASMTEEVAKMADAVNAIETAVEDNATPNPEPQEMDADAMPTTDAGVEPASWASQPDMTEEPVAYEADEPSAGSSDAIDALTETPQADTGPITTERSDQELDTASMEAVSLSGLAGGDSVHDSAQTEPDAILPSAVEADVTATEPAPQPTPETIMETDAADDVDTGRSEPAASPEPAKSKFNPWL